jgi:CubicO group peptidase (beta-lactamase class C family)
MRFCQMLLNGGTFNQTRLLKAATIKQMSTNQVGDLQIIPHVKCGLGFYILAKPDTHRLRGGFGWAGFYSTDFLVVPQGEWSLVVMMQVFGQRNSWRANYQELAANAIL